MAWFDHTSIKPIRQLVNEAFTKADKKFVAADALHKKAERLLKEYYSELRNQGNTPLMSEEEIQARRITDDARKELAKELRTIADIIEQHSIHDIAQRKQL